MGKRYTNKKKRYTGLEATAKDPDIELPTARKENWKQCIKGISLRRACSVNTSYTRSLAKMKTETAPLDLATRDHG